MVTVAVIFIITSFLASTLVICAGVLSSRISQAQGVTEEYEAMMVPQPVKKFRSRTYPVEVKG